jgi:hypothetical protein
MPAVEKQTGEQLIFQAGQPEANGFLGGGGREDGRSTAELIAVQPAGFGEDGFSWMRVGRARGNL